MTDILETMRAELDEGAALLRPHYPDTDDDASLERARYWRPWRYENGRWPSAEEIEFYKAHGRVPLNDNELAEWLETQDEQAAETAKLQAAE